MWIERQAGGGLIENMLDLSISIIIITSCYWTIDD